jgi:NMD protein affecting ribosome stability and mRNA decay
MKTESNLGSRRDRLIHEHIHDPYKTPHKLVEPTICPECGAVFHAGRWQWMSTPPVNALKTSCQACHRIRDNYPAGIVTLSGGFLREHRAELLNLVRNQETAAKQDHPLHRIMAIDETDDSLVIKTTDLHLPRAIADAVQDAYRGDLKLHYDEEGYFLRVEWQREN